jgi:hypothetical protein
MVLTLVAELLAGETLISPGGPVDSETAASGEVSLWFAGAVPALVEARRALEEAGAVHAAAHPARR